MKLHVRRLAVASFAIAPILACTAITGLGKDYTFRSESEAGLQDAATDRGVKDAARVGCSGSQSCAVGEICCGETSGFFCVLTCTTGKTLYCVQKSDCATGEVCCANQTHNGGVTSACTLACTAGKELCDPAVASSCGPGIDCKNANGDLGLPGSFGLCGG